MEKKQYQTKGKALLEAHLAEMAGTPRTAQEIYLSLKENTDAPGKSSVYRMLTELCEAGVVKRHRLPPPAQGYAYQYVGNAHHCEAHFHLHCLRCGNVWHLECECGSEIAAHLQKTHGFCTDRGRSVFYGVCAACSEKGAVTV